MSAQNKLAKVGKDKEPTELELQVAQALFDLENNSTELKKDLRPIQINAVRE
ncbi:40S ribosomal protein S7-3, partial [Dispira parvispora]